MVTLGRGDGAYDLNKYWVSSYTLSVSMDGVNFTPLFDGKVFDGNTDCTTKKENRFAVPVLTKYVRIYPVTSVDYVCLRAGLLVRLPMA